MSDYIPSVGVLVVNSQGQLLFAQRLKPPYAGKFGNPAGKVEPGESYLGAAIRELYEETGIAASPSNLVYLDNYYVDNYLVAAFVYSSEDDDPFPEDKEPDKNGPWGWYFLGDLPPLSRPAEINVDLFLRDIGN